MGRAEKHVQDTAFARFVCLLGFPLTLLGSNLTVWQSDVRPQNCFRYVHCFGRI